MAPDKHSQSDRELQEMQKEWRSSVTDALSELRATTKQIVTDLHQFKIDAVKQQDVIDLKTKYTELDERINVIEKDKQKLMGILLAAQVAISVAIFFIKKYIFNSP